MFHKYLLKDWSSSHFLHCGLCLDYPKDNISSSKILLGKENELGFLEAIVSFTQFEGGKKKGTSLGKRKGKE